MRDNTIDPERHCVLLERLRMLRTSVAEARLGVFLSDAPVCREAFVVPCGVLTLLTRLPDGHFLDPNINAM